MGKIPAVHSAADRAAGDIHLIAGCVSALYGGKAAVDVAYGGTRFEVDGVDGAVVLCRLCRARARCPAAVGIAVRCSVDGERVLRRCVADDGAPCPDILGRASRARGDIGALELESIEVDLCRRARSCVRIDDTLMGIGQGGEFWPRIRPPEIDIARILHEDGASGRRCSRIGDGSPIQIRCSPAHNVQHGICLIERARKVKAHLAEVLDVAHGGIRVDVELVVRYDITGGAARSAAIEHRIRERGRSQCAGNRADVDDVARSLARALGIAAVDLGAAAECSVLDVDGVARGIARRSCRECRIRRDIAAVELAAAVQRTAVDVDLVVLRVGILRGVDQFRMILILGISKEMHARCVTGIAVGDIAARKIQCIIFRATVLCVRISCTGIRMAAARDIQFVVIRCVAIDGQTCIGIARGRPGRCHILPDSCILEAIAVERDVRNHDGSRSRDIRFLSEFIVTDRSDECRRIIVKRHANIACI